MTKHIVYFIIEEPYAGYVKIGRTKNPQQRLTNLQTGNPRKLLIFREIPCNNLAAAQVIENELHAQYKKFRAHREWFKLSKTEISKIHSEFVDPPKKHPCLKIAGYILTTVSYLLRCFKCK